MTDGAVPALSAAVPKAYPSAAAPARLVNGSGWLSRCEDTSRDCDCCNETAP